MRALLILLAIVGVGAGTASAERGRVAKGYRHGRPMQVRVVDIDGTDVELATARALRAMRAAAAREGVAFSLHSGFRTHQRQAELYQEWRRGAGNLAARPGYSNHQSGRAVDLGLDAAGIAWMAANARTFGFYRTVRGEPWHWEFLGAPVKRFARRRR